MTPLIILHIHYGVGGGGGVKSVGGGGGELTEKIPQILYIVPKYRNHCIWSIVFTPYSTFIEVLGWLEYSYSVISLGAFVTRPTNIL